MSRLRIAETPTVVAIAIGGSIAIVGFLISPDWTTPLALVLPCSLPIAVAVAWRHGRAVVQSLGFPVGRVLIASLQAVVAGSVLVPSVGALASSITGSSYFNSVSDGIGWIAATAVLGMVFLGLPMLAIVVPVITVWASIARTLVRHQREPSG
jgi:hypothetical protein